MNDSFPTPVRIRDLVRWRALVYAYETLCKETGSDVFTLDEFRRAVDAYEDYRACHDRRKT